MTIHQCCNKVVTVAQSSRSRVPSSSHATYKFSSLLSLTQVDAKSTSCGRRCDRRLCQSGQLCMFLICNKVIVVPYVFSAIAGVRCKYMWN